MSERKDKMPSGETAGRGGFPPGKKGKKSGDGERLEELDRKTKTVSNRERVRRDERVVVKEAPVRKVRRGMGLGQRMGLYFFVMGICALIFFAAQGRFKLVFQYDRGSEFVVGVLDKNNRVPEKDKWYAFSFMAADRPAIASVVMFQRDRYSNFFVKKMGCLPGERLSYRGLEFMCEDAIIGKGIAKDGLSGREVYLYRWAGVVPPKKFFSVGMTRGSYDSKYRGFVDGDWIVGRVYPLLWMPRYLADLVGDKLEVR